MLTDKRVYTITTIDRYPWKGLLVYVGIAAIGFGAFKYNKYLFFASVVIALALTIKTMTRNMNWTISEDELFLQTSPNKPELMVKWQDITAVRFKHHGNNWYSRRSAEYGTLEIHSANGKNIFNFYDEEESAIAFMDDFYLTINKHNNSFATL